MKAIALSIAAVALLALSAVLATGVVAPSAPLAGTLTPSRAQLGISTNAPSGTKIPYDPYGGYLDAHFSADPAGCYLGGEPRTLAYVKPPGNSAYHAEGPYSGLNTARLEYGSVGTYSWYLQADCRAQEGPWLYAKTGVKTYTVECAGTITFVAGDVTVNGKPARRPTTIEGRPTFEYVDVAAGDVVETGAKSRVEIKLSDKSLLRIGPKSKIQLNKEACNVRGHSVSMKLIIGNIWAHLAHAVGGDNNPCEDGGPGFFFTYILVANCSHDTGGGVRDSTFEASYAPAQKLLRIRTDQHVSWIWGHVRGVRKMVKIPLGKCSQAAPRAAPTTPKPCAPFFVWGGRRI
jgi:hypothetical protein